MWWTLGLIVTAAVAGYAVGMHRAAATIEDAYKTVAECRKENAARDANTMAMMKESKEVFQDAKDFYEAAMKERAAVTAIVDKINDPEPTSMH